MSSDFEHHPKFHDWLFGPWFVLPTKPPEHPEGQEFELLGGHRAVYAVDYLALAARYEELRGQIAASDRREREAHAARNAATAEIDAAMALLAPKAEEETLLGAIRNLQQSNMTNADFAEKAELKIKELDKQLVAANGYKSNFEMYSRAWEREIKSGGFIPKTHRIDSLVLTTQLRIKERDDARAEVKRLESRVAGLVIKLDDQMTPQRIVHADGIRWTLERGEEGIAIHIGGSTGWHLRAHSTVDDQLEKQIVKGRRRVVIVLYGGEA